MPRKRMINPSFWRDEKIGDCSCMERLLFQGLWTFAEDNGVGRASPRLIKADVFPYDTLRDADIQMALNKLRDLGMILLYERDGQQYYFVKNFRKHQTINKPSQCYLPTPLPEDYGSTPVVVTSEEEEKLKEDKQRASALDAAFMEFWHSYPKKVGKAAAYKSFCHVPSEARPLLVPAVEQQKRSSQWNKDNGQYVPNPTTWLNQGRWEDELTDSAADKPRGEDDGYGPLLV